MGRNSSQYDQANDSGDDRDLLGIVRKEVGSSSD